MKRLYLIKGDNLDLSKGNFADLQEDINELIYSCCPNAVFFGEHRQLPESIEIPKNEVGELIDILLYEMNDDDFADCYVNVDKIYSRATVADIFNSYLNECDNNFRVELKWI